MNLAEQERLKYKPYKIQLLFIGESPPSGGTFFYFANSNLYRAIKKGFSKVYGDFNSDGQFLSFFKGIGCYLDDLCLIPVNNLSTSVRDAERVRGIKPLSRRINEYEPKMIIIVMKAIQSNVLTAIQNSNTKPIIEIIPFPGGSEKNRLNCIEGTANSLKKAKSLGLNNSLT
jgi:hypothetical protein